VKIILGIALGLAIFCGLVGGWFIYAIPPIHQEPGLWAVAALFIGFVLGAGGTMIVVMLSQGSLSLFNHVNDVREHRQEREKEYQAGFRALTDMFRAANQGQQFLGRQEVLPSGPSIIFDEDEV
jgi:hypothetical protein